MTYGRILLIGALAFGAIVYYQSEQAERAKEARQHQTNLQDAAYNQREAERYREEQARELAQAVADAKREAEEAPRVLTQAYIDCFGRRPPRDPAFMSADERLKLWIEIDPTFLAANAAVRSPCRN